MSFACTRMSFVCHSYVIRMYSYGTRMSSVCTRMSFVCHSYVLACHSYVTRMSFVCQSYVFLPWTIGKARFDEFFLRFLFYVIILRHYSLYKFIVQPPWFLKMGTIWRPPFPPPTITHKRVRAIIKLSWRAMCLFLQTAFYKVRTKSQSSWNL